MKKYKVKIFEVWSYEINMEADSPEDAKDQAQSMAAEVKRTMPEDMTFEDFLPTLFLTREVITKQEWDIKIEEEKKLVKEKHPQLDDDMVREVAWHNLQKNFLSFHG